MKSFTVACLVLSAACTQAYAYKARAEAKRLAQTAPEPEEDRRQAAAAEPGGVFGVPPAVRKLAPGVLPAESARAAAKPAPVGISSSMSLEPEQGWRRALAEPAAVSQAPDWGVVRKLAPGKKVRLLLWHHAPGGMRGGNPRLAHTGSGTFHGTLLSVSDEWISLRPSGPAWFGRPREVTFSRSEVARLEVHTGSNRALEALRGAAAGPMLLPRLDCAADSEFGAAVALGAMAVFAIIGAVEGARSAPPAYLAVYQAGPRTHHWPYASFSPELVTVLAASWR